MKKKKIAPEEAQSLSLHHTREKRAASCIRENWRFLLEGARVRVTFDGEFYKHWYSSLFCILCSSYHTFFSTVKRYVLVHCVGTKASNTLISSQKIAKKQRRRRVPPIKPARSLLRHFQNNQSHRTTYTKGRRHCLVGGWVIFRVCYLGVPRLRLRGELEHVQRVEIPLVRVQDHAQVHLKHAVRWN